MTPCVFRFLAVAVLVVAVEARPVKEKSARLERETVTGSKSTVDKASKTSASGKDFKVIRDGLMGADIHQAGLNRGYLKAIFSNDADAVRFSLGAGADILTVTETGSTGLHIACEKGNIKIVRELLFRDKSLVHVKNNEGMTPIHSAALYGQVNIVQMLVDDGADINGRDIYGATTLHSAAFSDDSLLGRFLLWRGANATSVDRYSSTPLHIAAYAGNKLMVSLLAVEGVPINAQDKSGSTALHVASYNGHGHCIRELMMMGANKEIRNADGRSAQDLWCLCSKESKPSIVCASFCASGLTHPQGFVEGVVVRRRPPWPTRR